MKTIIVKNVENGTLHDLQVFVRKLEKYTDYQIKDAFICTRYLDKDNYNTVTGELKDAANLNDFDLFIVALCSNDIDTTALKSINKAHTLICTADDLDSAKNFVIMI